MRTLRLPFLLPVVCAVLSISVLVPQIASGAWWPAYNYGVDWSPHPAYNVNCADAGHVAYLWQHFSDYDPVVYNYVWASAVANNIPNLYIFNDATHGNIGRQAYFYTPGRLQTDGTYEYVSCMRSDLNSAPSTHEHIHTITTLSGYEKDHQCNHYRYISDIPSTDLRVALVASCYSSWIPSGGRGFADALVAKGADCVIGFNREITISTAYNASPQYFYNNGFWRAMNGGAYVSQAAANAEYLLYQNLGYYGGWVNKSIRGVDRRL